MSPAALLISLEYRAKTTAVIAIRRDAAGATADTVGHVLTRPL